MRMSNLSTSTLIGFVVVLAIVAGLFFAFSANRGQQQLLSITNFEQCAEAGYPVMPARRSLGAGGESYPRQCRTPDGRNFTEDISDVSDTQPDGGISFNGCVVAGCSGQLCVSAEEASEIVTTCEFRAEYACYKEASCEPQADGKCGWTQTSDLKRCLASPPAVDENPPQVF